MSPVLLNSINYLKPEHCGMVAVAGSHGGLYSAFKAVSCRVGAVILNDAGVGKDGAGIASLAFCEKHGLPVACVGYMSARIGDAADMLARGRVSFCNAPASALGVRPGMVCAEAARLLEGGRPEWKEIEAMRECRYELSLSGSGPAGGSRSEKDETVVCMDSASLILPDDAGRVVVTGSHGSLIGGDAAKAINVPARFAAFNDAGFGVDEAGAGRLVPLADMGVAAVLVDCMSARIGDGRSTLDDGVISSANTAAAAVGFRKGLKLSEALRGFMLE